jgi:hypothetical protein
MKINIKEIRELVNRKYFTNGNAKRYLNKFLDQQEKKDELLENVKDILALNYSYQEIGIKISKLFKQLEEELK